MRWAIPILSALCFLPVAGADFCCEDGLWVDRQLDLATGKLFCEYQTEICTPDRSRCQIWIRLEVYQAAVCSESRARTHLFTRCARRPQNDDRRSFSVD